MKITQKTTHVREAFCTLSELQINEILAAHVAREAGYDVTSPHVSTKVYISTKDTVGTAGVEKYAEVTIRHDLMAEPSVGDAAA